MAVVEKRKATRGEGFTLTKVHAEKRKGEEMETAATPQKVISPAILERCLNPELEFANAVLSGAFSVSVAVRPDIYFLAFGF